MEEGQKIALALIPKITGLFSFCFSSMIVYTIIRNKRRRERTYDRLLLGMSLADMSSSFWIGLSTWPIPKESGAYWSAGNQTTCNVQGFFIQLGLTSALYNGSLSFYYLLVTRYGWKEQELKQSWIPFLLHAIPTTWCLGTAIASGFLTLYNNASLWCWIAEAPSLDRGAHGNTYRWSFFYGPLWLTIVLVTINLALVVSQVRKVTIKAEHNVLPEQSTTNNNNNNDSINKNKKSSTQQEDDFSESSDSEDQDGPEFNIKNKNSTIDTATTTTNKVVSIEDGAASQEKAALVAARFAQRRTQLTNQSIRYAVAFYITWIPITCVRIIQTLNHPVPFNIYFPFLVLGAAFTPCQGLPNFIVYWYPQYQKAKHRAPNAGCCTWISRTISTLWRHDSHTEFGNSTKPPQQQPQKNTNSRGTPPQPPPSAAIATPWPEPPPPEAALAGQQPVTKVQPKEEQEKHESRGLYDDYDFHDDDQLDYGNDDNNEREEEENFRKAFKDDDDDDIEIVAKTPPVPAPGASPPLVAGDDVETSNSPPHLPTKTEGATLRQGFIKDFVG